MDHVAVHRSFRVLNDVAVQVHLLRHYRHHDKLGGANGSVGFARPYEVGQQVKVVGAAEDDVAARFGGVRLIDSGARTTLALHLAAAQFNQQLKFLVGRTDRGCQVEGGASEKTFPVGHGEYTGQVTAECFVKRFVLPLVGSGGQEVAGGSTVDQPLAAQNVSDNGKSGEQFVAAH